MIAMSDLSLLKIRLGFICLIAALAYVSSVQPAVSASKDIYEIHGVDVDVTAETAALARVKALAEGEQVAFRRLLEQLTLAGDRDRLPVLDKAELSTYVRDFGVSNEKTSSGRYLARLSYRFKRGAVRSLLNEFNLPFAETISSPVLVLPVFQAGGGMALWDDPNPWREVWAKKGEKSGLVPLVQPLGDLKDVGAITATQAVQGDLPRLNKIAARYLSKDVVVAYGLQRLDPVSKLLSLEVYVTRYDNKPDPETETFPFIQNEGESTDALLRRAVNGVSDMIEDGWKRSNVLDLNHPNIATIAVPITGLADWIAVQKRLKDVPLIRRTELVLLSLDEVRINLHYVGQTEQLTGALGQAELTLVNEDGEWVLYLADVRPADKS